jgi:peptide/nickel transport system substrate-binding protein
VSPQTPRQGTLRVVPQSNLAVLDPVWTTAGITQIHGYHIFDTLYSPNGKFEPKPQMADGHEMSGDGLTWKIRLREGLVFHDGEPVRGIDAVSSIVRWSKKDPYGSLLLRNIDEWETPNDRTIRIRLKRPFPRLLDALGRQNPPFVMPERLAGADPNTKITEMIGSGPYQFVADEFIPGSRVTYARFTKYVPRQEPPDWLSGGKRAYFDRIEWHILPDSSTAAAALLAGEVDWWQFILPSLASVLARNGTMRIEKTDPYGSFAFLRFNSLIPPFNDPKLKRIVLSAIDQNDFLSVVVDPGEGLSRPCLSMFPCGLPYVTEAGSDLMGRHVDLEAARRAISEAGYEGHLVVILDPTDIPTFKGFGEVAANLLRKLGFKVDLQAMDWGTLIQRRMSMRPVDQGGWNIFPTDGPSPLYGDPLTNITIRGTGPGGWVGWYSNPEVEDLIERWVDSDGPEKRQELFDAIHRSLFESPPNAPLGQYFMTTAFRSDLTGRIPCIFPLPWNIRRI